MPPRRSDRIWWWSSSASEARSACTRPHPQTWCSTWRDTFPSLDQAPDDQTPALATRSTEAAAPPVSGPEVAADALLGGYGRGVGWTYLGLVLTGGSTFFL